MIAILRNLTNSLSRTENKIIHKIKPLTIRFPKFQKIQKKNIKIVFETSGAKQLLNNFAIRNKQFMIVQSLGLSDLVRNNKMYSNRHEEIIFSGDYKVSQVGNFIHALFLNRKGASEFFFTMDDLNTTKSEYKREKIIDL